MNVEFIQTKTSQIVLKLALSSERYKKTRFSVQVIGMPSNYTQSAFFENII